MRWAPRSSAPQRAARRQEPGRAGGATICRIDDPLGRAYASRMRPSRRELLRGLVAGSAFFLAHTRLGVGIAATDAEVERAARSLEGRLIAPCCFSQVLGQHHSPQASEMKSEIRARLRAGWSEERILEDYTERLGERVLAAPRRAGFNWLAYLAPPLFVLAGTLVTAGWLARHSRRRSPERDTPPEAPHPDLAEPGRRARLEALVAARE